MSIKPLTWNVEVQRSVCIIKIHVDGFVLLSMSFGSGFKLINGKALRKHSLHEKTAAFVLLKLFISGNE